MAKEHQSEDQRLTVVEQTLPGIQRALADLSARVNSLPLNTGSTSGLDFIQPRNRLVDVTLFEQTLSLLRTLYLFPAPMPTPPPSFTASATILADPSCIKVIFDGDVIKSGHTVFLEDTGIVGTQDPSDCFTISRPLVYDGHAEAVICCKKGSARPDRDCSTESAIVTVRDPANLNPGTTTPRLIAALLISFGCAPQPV